MAEMFDELNANIFDGRMINWTFYDRNGNRRSPRRITDPLPELTREQAEAVETLFELHCEARLDGREARTAFLAVALLLAQRQVLDYLVATLLKQAEAINIPPTKSLLFRDMAFEIENAMREGNQEKG